MTKRSTSEPEADEAGSAPPAWVYLLRCRDDSLYTGWTIDLGRRLARHEAGTASRYTASRRPLILAAAFPMADRSSARREEARIKRLDRAAKLALVATAHPIPDV
jgi:putative endonuclease